MTKLISWNVNGLRACVGKGFLDFFREAEADVFCIQESKLQEGQIELDLPGYHQYWNYARKKGYSGTAMFTKEEPMSVSYGIGMWPTRKLTLRILRQTGKMPDSPMKRGESSPTFWQRASWTRSAISIRTWRGYTPGGPTVSAPGPRMQGGALTIFVYQKALRTDW